MERIIDISPEALEASLRLSLGDRLRRADAAFRLYLDLHRPFAEPLHRGFEQHQKGVRSLREISKRTKGPAAES